MPYVFHVLTLFPDLIRQATSYSLLKKAQEAGIIEIRTYNIRDHATDRHKTVDDVPYGGGPGMVMKVEPVARCLALARSQAAPGTKAYLLSAAGVLFNQEMAKAFAKEPSLILVCGRYEGVDERIAEYYVDGEVSIGDYVLSGGEVGALAIIEAVSRLLPGVVGNEESLAEESHVGGLLEYPHYTRPRVFEGHEVPQVLLSGNHKEIERFRREAALAKTIKNRPDLIERYGLGGETQDLPLGRPKSRREGDG